MWSRISYAEKENPEISFLRDSLRHSSEVVRRQHRCTTWEFSAGE